MLHVSQIKVRDMSNAKLTIHPADYTTWSDARTALITEKKNALRSELEGDLAALTSHDKIEETRQKFNEKERKIEHEIDHTVHTFSATLDVGYNFLAK